MNRVPPKAIARQLVLCAETLEAKGWFDESYYLLRLAQSARGLGGGAVLPEGGAAPASEDPEESGPVVVGPTEMTLEEQLLADREEDDDGLDPLNMLGFEDAQGGATFLHPSQATDYLSAQGAGDFPPAGWGAKLRGR